MTEHTPRAIERVCDAAVIGGSVAGLAAALQLGRQRRSVIVVDAGEPRNAPAAEMHSVLGSDGDPPAALTSAGRGEVRSYGGEVLDGRVDRVLPLEGGEFDGRYRVELSGGHSLVARRVLVATGIVDELPTIEGLAAHWGGAVIHCPFCHGYEVRDRQLVQLISHPIGFHPAALIRQLSGRMTVVIDDALATQHGTDLDRLQRSGVEIVRGSVERVVDGENGGIAGLDVSGGRHIAADALFITPRFRPRVEALAPLVISTSPHPTGLGHVVDVDDRGETSVPGVHAAGNVVDPSQQVLQAAADGGRVGAMISFSLASEDLDADNRTMANEFEWDRRYSGDSVWSGNPNGTLVEEVAGMPPGRALDVGAGEGADAVWLAQQGWTVTATDVSGRALERVAAGAADHGVALTCHRADANQPGAFAAEGFDLVSVQYGSIGRTPDGRAVENLVGAVADGGTLLVVGHDHQHRRKPVGGAVDDGAPIRAFDPEAYVGVDDIRAAINARPGWSIETHETRPRPGGSATGSLHPDDVVLRARRRSSTSER